MKTRISISKLTPTTFLLSLAGWMIFSLAAWAQNDTIPIHVNVSHPDDFFTKIESVVEVEKSDLEGGQSKVVNVAVEDMSGGKYNLQITVKRPLRSFNLFYNKAVKGTEKKIGTDQLNRFDNSRRERQVDLYNLSFGDEDGVEVSHQFNPPLPDWVADMGKPKVIVVPPPQPTGPATTGGMLDYMGTSNLEKFPYIGEIWGKVGSMKDLQTIPPEKFEEFFANLKSKKTNFNDIFKTMGIHKGFDSLPVLKGLYDKFSLFPFDGNQTLKQQYPALKNYGTVYLALLGKDPAELKKLYEEVEAINKRIANKEEIGVSDLEVLNEAARFIARAAIITRHGGLFYLYSDSIIGNNPYFFNKFQKGGTSESMACGPQSLTEEDEEFIKKVSSFTAVAKEMEKRQREEALKAYLSMLGSEMGSSFSSKKSWDLSGVFDGFEKVTIGGGGNRCWMRSTWFSIFDFFKNNPKEFNARIAELFAGDKIPDAVAKLMAESDKILDPKQTSKFGIDSAGNYEKNTEEAIALITRQIIVNEGKKHTNARDGFLKEAKVLAQKLVDEDATLSGLEKAAIAQKIKTATTRAQLLKGFVEEQESMLGDLSRGRFGGTEAMVQMFEAIVGHKALRERNESRSLLYISSSQENTSIATVGTPKDQLERYKKTFDGVIHRPVVYGTGTHFDIYIPKDETLAAREEMEKKNQEELIAKLTGEYEGLALSTEDNRDWLRAALYLALERAEKAKSTKPDQLKAGILAAYERVGKDVPVSVGTFLEALTEIQSTPAFGVGKNGKFSDVAEAAIFQMAKDFLDGADQVEALATNGPGEWYWVQQMVFALLKGPKMAKMPDQQEIPLVRLGRSPTIANKALAELEKAKRDEDSLVVMNPVTGFDIFVKKSDKK